MSKGIKFTKIPKGKEKHRLYYFPTPNVEVDNNSPFFVELEKLAKGEIKEIDLDKVDEEREEYEKSKK